ncbi:NUDIX domain-containing protein [Kitasatospora sp. NPDC059577]|uniref:NUDIX domain-containing protein n=1 Tax=Kitasatospora sp. NPDC059577 TaxID=3346873 RepID=UPI0036895D97
MTGTVCRHRQGRVPVHRRPGNVSRAAGHHEVMSGGAVDVGESHAQAAARESAEELGVRAPVRFVCAFLCRGGRAGGRRSARTGSACTRPRSRAG